MTKHLPIVLCLATTLPLATADDRTWFRITTRRKDDRVAVRLEKCSAIVTIHSPSGISHAVITRAGEKWPDAVVLRLHLQGLEHLRLTNGQATVEASASLRGGKPAVRVWKGEAEGALLDAKHPLWFDVRVLDGAGQPAREIPVKGGCFEMPLPRALLDENPSAITVSWIDFYRT